MSPWAHRRLENKNMLRNIFRRQALRLVAGNENTPEGQDVSGDKVPIARVRALATGAALATSVDNSPAVLVSIYDYAHRYRDRGRRTA
jgi:hypothetical protein